MSDYEKQANDFLSKTNTTLTVVYKKHDKHFIDDKESRDIYEITLSRGTRKYTFNFGQSIYHSKEFMINTANYPTYVTKKEMLDDCIKKGYPIRYATKNPKFKAPTAYDVLSCLEKYDIGTFENFCDEFGYDTDSMKAFKTYEAVGEAYKQVAILFNEAELKELAEIQ